MSDALKSPVTPAERPFHLLVQSAPTADALCQSLQQLLPRLAAESVTTAELCAQVNRAQDERRWRLALLGDSTAAIRTQGAAFVNGRRDDLIWGEADGARVAFLFTGHGAQYVQMGRQLWATQPVFRQAILACKEGLRPYLDVDLCQILYPGPDDPDQMDRMTTDQPALFAIEYALARLWLSWGVRPQVVMGHSLGEYVAATIAGVFRLEDGLKLVASRGRLMDSLSQTGEMAAIFAGEEQVVAAVAPFADEASIAVINGPKNVVVSGSKTAVFAIMDQLKTERVRSRRLAVAQAAHSPLLDPILNEFESVAQTVTYQEPQIPLVSTVTGQLAQPGELTQASYWRRHLRQPVRFAGAMQTLFTQEYDLFLEIGPHPILVGNGKRCLPSDYGLWLGSLHKEEADWPHLLTSLAQLYVRGVAVDWDSYFDV